jgi:hypothetical protein
MVVIANAVKQSSEGVCSWIASGCAFAMTTIVSVIGRIWIFIFLKKGTRKIWGIIFLKKGTRKIGSIIFLKKGHPENWGHYIFEKRAPAKFGALYF